MCARLMLFLTSFAKGFLRELMAAGMLLPDSDWLPPTFGMDVDKNKRTWMPQVNCQASQ